MLDLINAFIFHLMELVLNLSIYGAQLWAIVCVVGLIIASFIFLRWWAIILYLGLIIWFISVYFSLKYINDYLGYDIDAIWIILVVSGILYGFILLVEKITNKFKSK